MDKRIIRVLVDGGEVPRSKAARASFRSLLQDMAGSVMELELDVAEREIGSCFETIKAIIAQLPQDGRGPRLKTVTFSICLDSTGKASLLSAVSASSGIRTGLTFTIECPGGIDEHE